MIKNNPGCILPFYRQKTWQRHRQHGQNEEAFGMKAPNARLLPFQIRGTTGTAGTVTWKLVNAKTETEETALTGGLVANNVSGGGWYVTWFATSDINSVPDCGYYYVVVFVNGVPYYSEVLHLDGVSENDLAGISLADCDFAGGVATFVLAANDTVSSTIENQEIGFFGSGSWQVIGAAGGSINWNDNGPIQVYRRVTLATGRQLTVYGEINFSDPNDPCADAALTVSAQVTNGETELWRVRFAFGQDRGTVLYQNGWQQWFYLKERPTFVTPVFDIDEDAKTNGFGVEQMVVATITERLPFEFFPVPDFSAEGIIACCYGCDFGLLEETITAHAYQLNAPRFSLTSESIGLGKGQITSVVTQTTLTCSDNIVLL